MASHRDPPPSAIKGEGGKAPLGGGAVNPPAAKKASFFLKMKIRCFKNVQKQKNMQKYFVILLQGGIR